MLAKSPTSQAIALRQMQIGGALSLRGGDDEWSFGSSRESAAGMISMKACARLIVDKDNRPQWRPAAAEAVSKADIDAYFAPLGEDDLTFAGGRADERHRMRQAPRRRDSRHRAHAAAADPRGRRRPPKALAALRWTALLVWFMRTHRGVWIAKGLFAWTVVLGRQSRASPISSNCPPSMRGDDRLFRRRRSAGGGRAVAGRALGRGALADLRGDRELAAPALGSSASTDSASLGLAARRSF